MTLGVVVDTSRVPGDDASELDWLIFEQSGVLTYRQAVGCLTPGCAASSAASDGGPSFRESW